MDDALPAAPRGTRRVRVALTVGAVLLIGVVVALFVLPKDHDRDDGHSSAARAIARLDANDGNAYIGKIGDVTDALRLRRTLRSELRSDVARTGWLGAAARARRCADVLQRVSTGTRGRVVVLADAALGGEPAVVVGITDRGRVVAFVADATTCGVRMAQSL